MDTWIDVRRKAQECHEEALARANGDRRAVNLISAALDIDDLEIEYYEPGSIVEKAVVGFLERRSRLINIASGQDQRGEAVVVAHEIGHFKLHHDPLNEVTVTSPFLGGDSLESGVGRVEGYSSRERKEIQADVFAGEFLCPSGWLRREYIEKGRRPREIASELGLPLNLVLNQTIRALLLPPIRPAEPGDNLEKITLDDSQRKAATWTSGPLLVDAGPGTGKTRTLVHRIRHLLENGIPAGSILALTFSKKAAEEMRERLSLMDPKAAIEMWVGTFHSFGLEIVSKWPGRIGRSSNVRIIDQTGALALLEDNLTRLPLHHFQNLYEPAYELVHVLKAISRCKDELISPSCYRDAAESSLQSASTDDEREKAEKVLEVAAIYEIYEKLLKENDAVDFGDLVMLAAQVLEEHEEIRTHFHRRFRHIVVDEYQDVNRASAQLLRILSGPEVGVWVVADQRQSIYRFRGAEPSNVERFEQEFGGTRHSLGHNYRSLAAVVRVFERFSSTMNNGTSMAGSWKAQKGNGGEVTYTIAPTLAAEAESIRDMIETFRRKGVRYGQQIILARTHRTLARITGILEQLGVPLLYLGDLFERAEIRDLLSLIGLDAEFGGVGLVRVAAMPEYAVPRSDALIVIRWATESRVSIIEALAQVGGIEGISDAGKQGLGKLASQLDGVGYATSPWVLLTTFLFESSDYLRPLLTAEDVISQQKLIAIYHLLKVCSEHVASGDTSRKRFLDRVRRIEALNDDTIYRAVASEAADLDAVRVMTIHGSKGLEFRAVHLPGLATRYMPTIRQPIRVPPPNSLPHLVMQAEYHDAEEECLFFVGISRAKDYLSLTRAERYTTQNAGESRFLASLLSLISTRKYLGSGKIYSLAAPLQPRSLGARYRERDLDVYLHCPARYLYQSVEGLRGSRDDSAYVRFHRCVYRTVGWLEQQRQAGNAINNSIALAELTAVWGKDGPIEHPFEKYYRHAAEDMVLGMALAIASEAGEYDRKEWNIQVGEHTIVITPDRVLIDSAGIVHVQQIRTGRRTKSELEKPIYALLRTGAGAIYPGKRVSIEALYLVTGERVAIPVKNDPKLIQKYVDAIAGIERGDFHPEPDPRRCPNCPCYFMCGN